MLRVQPEVYDYVIIEGYPMGQYTYTSPGNVQRTVRKFSAKLEEAFDWNLQTGAQDKLLPRKLNDV